MKMLPHQNSDCLNHAATFSYLELHYFYHYEVISGEGFVEIWKDFW